MNDRVEKMNNGTSNWRFISLGRSLLLWFLLLALLPLSLNAWFGYRQMVISLTAAATHELERGAAQKAKFIKNWFKYRVLDLEGQAGNSQNVEFLTVLQKGLRSSKQTPAEFVKSNAWTQLVSQRQQDLQAFEKRYDYLDNILLIDSTGAILYTVQQDEDLGDNVFTGFYADSEFSRIARTSMESGQLLFSDFRNYGLDDNHLAGFLSAPVLAKNGNIIGVIAFQLSLARIKQLMQERGDKTSLVHYLVGEDGLARTPIRNVDTARAATQRVSTQQYTLWMQHERQAEHDPSASVQQSAFEYQGPAGQTVIGLHQPVLLPGVNWALISEIDRDEALAGAHKVGDITLMIFLLSSVLIALLATFLARRITRPIVQLADASNAIAAGDTYQQVVVSANNEIGLLARSFNEMVDNRARYQDALEESNQIAQQAFTELEVQKFALDEHAIVAITDVQGTITYVNKKFTEISGYSSEELVGQNHRMLKSAHHDQAFFREMFRTIASGEVWHGEVCNRAKDGHLYWVGTTIVPFKGEDGKPQSYIAIRTDITSRKQAEAELILAKELAEESTRLKSDFLANMSHEIRTPMNGVIGMTSLLLETELSSKQRHYGENCLRSADALLTIINDILDVSKIEAGKLELETIAFDLQVLSEDVMELMVLKCREKGVELLLRYPPDMPRTFMGDPGRIRQILLNLMSNAIKFTAEGSIVLSLEIQEQTAQQVSLEVRVKDSGVGIAADKLGKVFNKFDQEDGSTTRQFGGTGLGLTICKQLCEMMQGGISVESEKGEGSTFAFTIKLALVDEQDAPPVLAIDNKSLNGVKALIVDDLTIARTIISEQISPLQLSVDTAASGQQALDILEQACAVEEPFDVVITDSKMPGMDGEMLAAQIQQRALLENGALLFITSLPRQGDGQRLNALGVDAYLTKPTHAGEIAQIISMVLQAKQKGQKLSLMSRHTLREAKAIEKSHKKIRFKDTRILLAEDNPINQMVAIEHLENYGCTIIAANDGAEALEKFKTQHFDLVFMDCQMPEMDGYESTAAIRQNEIDSDRPRMPIIAFTANAMRHDQEKCFAAGMDDFLPKPVRREVMEELLKKWLPYKFTLIDEQMPVEKVVNENAQKAEPQTSVQHCPLDVWNKSEALERMNGKEKVLKRMIALFVDDMPERVNNLQQAIESEQTEDAANIAHAIKGVAGNISGAGLQQWAAKLEAAGKSGDAGQLKERWPAFFEQFQLLNQCLQQE